MRSKKQKNPNQKDKKATALSYSGKEKAPRVLASGKGYVAQNILEKGKEEKIPIHKDEELAENLSSIEIGDFIPPELYEVVSQVLTFVGDMDELKSEVMKETH